MAGMSCHLLQSHLMYLFKNLLWKSFRIVSLTKRFWALGSPLSWFRKTTSSSHLLFTCAIDLTVDHSCQMFTLQGHSRAYHSSSSVQARCLHVGLPSERVQLVHRHKANSSWRQSSVRGADLEVSAAPQLAGYERVALDELLLEAALRGGRLLGRSPGRLLLALALDARQLCQQLRLLRLLRARPAPSACAAHPASCWAASFPSYTGPSGAPLTPIVMRWHR